MHSPDMACIYRLFDPDLQKHYWAVTIQRNGKSFAKRFVEKRHGGEQAALKLAQAWRDSIIAKHPAMSMAQFCSIVRKNNTSGIPGVRFHNQMYRRKNGTVTYRPALTAMIPLENELPLKFSSPKVT